jgi:hypothetical protein
VHKFLDWRPCAFAIQARRQSVGFTCYRVLFARVCRDYSMILPISSLWLSLECSSRSVCRAELLLGQLSGSWLPSRRWLKSPELLHALEYTVLSILPQQVIHLKDCNPGCVQICLLQSHSLSWCFIVKNFLTACARTWPSLVIASLSLSLLQEMLSCMQ